MKSLTQIISALLFFSLLGSSSAAQSGVITTVAGNGSAGFNGDGGLATAAKLNLPDGVAVDTSGNLFIADTQNNRVRKVMPGGVISTVAGNGTAGFSGDGGPATSAQLCAPRAVAVDTVGNLLIADSFNHRIRKVTPAGVISTVAGNGTSGFSGDGGPATSAQFNAPQDVAVDIVGNLFIADTSNSRVRKVTPDGMTSTIAGNGTKGFSGDGGPAIAAILNWPSRIELDLAGNLLIADSDNSRVRKVTPGGVISTIAGNGTRGSDGDGGPATAANLYSPYGLAVDAAGNLFIADSGGGNRVRRVTPGNVISTVAGNGTYGFSGDGGAPTKAQLGGPSGIAVDAAGNLFIADTANNRVRKVTLTLVDFAAAFFPHVVVGGGYSTLFTVTNTGADSASGKLILTDQQGKPLSVNGTLTDSSGITQPTLPGHSFPFTVPAGGIIFLSATGLTPGSPATVGWGQLDSTEGSLSGVATYEYVVGSMLQTMVGVLQSQPLQYATIPVDNNSSQSKQTAYAIANPSSQTIAIKLALVGQDDTVVDDTVTVTLLPGQQIATYLWQALGRTDFKGSLVLRGQNSATFVAVALVEKRGVLTAVPLITQLGSIIGLAQSDVISTVAGNGSAGFSGDGGPATLAGLGGSGSVAVDTSGNLFIADGTDRVRKVMPGGVISTVAGNGIAGFSGDGGPATAAQIGGSTSVAVDTLGNLFIADPLNNRVRKVTFGGVISTVAGNGAYGFSGDGGLATSAQLKEPTGVAVDAAGNLYIADIWNHRIRQVTPGGVISTVAGNGIAGFSGDGGPATSAEFYCPVAVAVDSSGNLFIADTQNDRLRKVTPSGVISTVAGNGTFGFSGDGGPATAAKLNYSLGVTVDTSGNLFIADTQNHRVRRVTPGRVISTVAGNGAYGFSGDGGLATAAEINFPNGVAVDTSGNLFIADTGNNRVRKVAPGNPAAAFFPQVAVGGGYSTLFTVTNTGADSASGSVILTDQQGKPLSVNGTLTDSSGITQPTLPGHSFPFTVPAGGIIFLSATGLTPGSPATVGWGQLDSTEGSLSGVATYEYVVGSMLQTMVGVLQSQPLQYATIPVDNNSSQSKQTAYAIANPSSQTIAIKLTLVGQDGIVIDDTVTVALLPGQQIATYLWQVLGRKDFKGSLVLQGQNSATFVAVALVEKQGVLTAIPLISGKASGVPN